MSVTLLRKPANPEEERLVSNYENASRMIKTNLKAGVSGQEHVYSQTYRKLVLAGLAPFLKRKYRK